MSVMPLRDAIAHAATPWEWRSRAAVVALVVVSFALPIAWIISIWLDDDVASPVVVSLIWGLLGLWLAVRPAVRSLRRWDEKHATTADVA